jgi:hypothetical protein
MRRIFADAGQAGARKGSALRCREAGHAGESGIRSRGKGIEFLDLWRGKRGDRDEYGLSADGRSDCGEDQKVL